MGKGHLREDLLVIGILGLRQEATLHEGRKGHAVPSNLSLSSVRDEVLRHLSQIAGRLPTNCQAPLPKGAWLCCTEGGKPE